MRFSNYWHVQCLSEKRFNSGTCGASYINYWSSDTNINAKPYCCNKCGTRNVVVVKTMRDLPGDLSRTVWDADFKAHGVASMVKAYIDYHILSRRDMEIWSVY